MWDAFVHNVPYPCTLLSTNAAFILANGAHISCVQCYWPAWCEMGRANQTLALDAYMPFFWDVKGERFFIGKS